MDVVGSLNCMEWSLLPPATEEMETQTSVVKGRFMGDPSHEYEHTELQKVNEGEKVFEEEVVVSEDEEGLNARGWAGGHCDGGKHGHHHSHWGPGAWSAGCARPWASVLAPSLHPRGPGKLVHCLQGVEWRKPLLSHLPGVTSLLSDDRVARGWAADGRAGLWVQGWEEEVCALLWGQGMCTGAYIFVSICILLDNTFGLPRWH